MNNKYPDCYLYVEECGSGETFIQSIRGNEKLNLRNLVKKWIKKQFANELTLDGDLIPKLSGDYYARIMTNGRPPESVVCWTSGGFYLK